MRSAATVATLLIPMLLLAHHGPNKVTIDAAAAKQPAVTFDHAAHATKLVKTCDTCHHTQKGLKSEQETKVVKCSTCHLNPKDPKIPGMREMSLAKNPFHAPLCIECHKAQKKGPVACTACHVKK
ncbi:MAG TPA: cytochrome c3 family protein [Thermoanaerobaculia bacterium]|nr:cytochrome c3 family protein [Thermoanaerobaculia bacterium]